MTSKVYFNSDVTFLPCLISFNFIAFPDPIPLVVKSSFTLLVFYYLYQMKKSIPTIVSIIAIYCRKNL